MTGRTFFVAVASTGFFESPTIRSALLVGTLVAVVAGILGVFTVIRGQSFAGHALADLSAVGGSGAFLVGVSQLAGFVVAGLCAGIVMELIGVRRLRGRDVSTGIILALGLGTTALFLYWDATLGTSSSATISVLFGSLFVLDPGVLPTVVILSIVALLIVVVLYRWLVMESFDPTLARARGIPVRFTSICFMLALALAVVLSSLTVGAILSTALLIGPAATALLLTRRVGRALVLAAVLGVVTTWLGCLLSYESYTWNEHTGNWPVSFCIVAVIFVLYVLTRLGVGLAQRRTHSRAVSQAARADAMLAEGL